MEIQPSLERRALIQDACRVGALRLRGGPWSGQGRHGSCGGLRRSSPRPATGGPVVEMRKIGVPTRAAAARVGIAAPSWASRSPA